MSKDLPQPQESEEVDLGQLFKLIGNMFDRFFKFIGSIFSKLYDVFLLLLIHLFKRLKWYVAVVLLGFVVGYFVDKNSEYLYGANMKIEANYNSTRQVYENISFLNQLAEVDRDSVELAKRLKITIPEAASIRGFSIEPNIDENDKMILFSDFRSQLDSLTKRTFTYNNYIEGLSSYSFKTHLIEVTSVDKFIYPKLNKTVANELVNNSYLNEIREVTIQNLNRKEKILNNQKKTLDSLRQMYLGIRELESKKEYPTSGAGTNLFLGDAQEQSLIVDETKLVERSLEFDNQKLEVYRDLIDKKYIINVISEFPAAGYDIGKLYKKAKFRLPLLFGLVILLMFIGVGLKRYLDKEEKRLLSK
jgi:hypothetical protein